MLKSDARASSKVVLVDRKGHLDEDGTKISKATKNIAKHVVEALAVTITHLNENQGFEKEFTVLDEVTTKQHDISKCQFGVANRSFNRYRDIIPYDRNRVILHACTPDYINATLFPPPLPGAPRFIATQGPKPETVRAFWEMMVEYKCKVIVMVTNTIEGSKIKCEQYWPVDGEPLQYNPEEGFPNIFEVSLIQQTDDLLWSQRKFLVTMADGTQHKITQFHFTDWPDYGVPISPQGFVDFVNTTLNEHVDCIGGSKLSKAPPLVVHCSAGVGRTGTYMTTCSLLSAIKNPSKNKNLNFDMKEFFKSLRSQRFAMIQTAQQYEFAYRTCLVAADKIIRTAEFQQKKKGSKVELKGVSPNNITTTPSSRQSFMQARPQRPSMARLATVWDDFVSLFTETPLIVPSILSEIVTYKEIEKSTEALLKLYGSQALLLPFAFKLAEWDIAKCEDKHLIYRKNTMATKLITTAMKTYGQGFLKKLLQPLLESMLVTPNKSYEINPTMLGPKENLSHNEINLKTLADTFFNAIISSFDRVPVAVRLICYGVARATASKFPESKATGVANGLFLRFISPAIVAPKAHHLIDSSTEIPPKVHRGLLLVSKVLQAAANPHRFTGFKEEYMQSMGAFVNLASTRGLEFLNRVSQPPAQLDQLTISAFSSMGIHIRCVVGKPSDGSTLGKRRDGCIVDSVEGTDLEALYKLVHKYIDPIRESLSEQQNTYVLDKFNNVLEEIGDPDDIATPAPPTWIAAHKIKQNLPSLLETTAAFNADGMEAVLKGAEYMDTGVKRGLVTFTSWHEFDKDYAPINFTSLDVMDANDADPDIEVESATLAFNTIDDKYGVDRRSFDGRYKLIDGVPRNPTQRTGIVGRGVLSRWGPNHYTRFILTRWRYKTVGGKKQRVMKNKQPLMDILLVDNNFKVELPQFKREIEIELPELLSKYFECKSIPPLNVVQSINVKKLKKFSDSVENAVQIFKGVPKDLRNTDNAWVENVTLWMHVPEGVRCTKSSEVLGKKLVWVPMQCRLNMEETDLDLMQSVAIKSHAFFTDQLPRICRNIMQEVERRGLFTEGLYRISGTTSRVKELKESLVLGKMEVMKEVQIPTLTSLLKKFLREMDPPLLTHKLYHDFVGCLDKIGEEQQMQLSSVLQKLPVNNYRLLSTLIHHLQRVASESVTNRMSLENLALLFGPTMMKSPDGVAQDMADNGKQIMVTSANLCVCACV
eukprot:m.12105 g.12105  ORF g.12105 m.12105 type:complete len:1216 (-) comp3955_c0_seq1:647-4294(-)